MLAVPTARVLRVFPVRTSHTPDDVLAFVGEPPFWRPEPAQVGEIHISVCFTWNLTEGERLAGAWQAAYPDVTVRLGGPAYGSPTDTFTPGMYVKRGIVFTSRGCPRKCPFCLVPDREGRLRLIQPIPEGYTITDNNFLACPREHRLAVYAMLARQSRAAVFAGGLDCRLVTEEVAEELRGVRISQAFLAADNAAILPALRLACERLIFLPRQKLRCYTLLGFDGETIGEARQRLEAVWEAGAMPFAQLYRPPTVRRLEYAPEWRNLQREWSRPAATKAMHQAVAYA